MTSYDEDADRAAIENIARPLRAPVHVDDTFEVRVMSAIHAEVHARSTATVNEQADIQPWWKKGYNIRVSPIGGLAVAASLLVAVIYGSAIFGGKSARDVAPAQTKAVANSVKPSDTQNVRFVLVNGSAQEVFIVGDFNGWSKNETPLVRAASGDAWTVSIPLANGRHEYAFIVRDEKGEHWIADPLAMTVRDDFGTESSVLRVGQTQSTS